MKITVKPYYHIRYRRKRSKVDAIFFDSARSHTRRSDASEKEKKIFASTFGQIRLWTTFESSPVSVKEFRIQKFQSKKKFQGLNFNQSGRLIFST